MEYNRELLKITPADFDEANNLKNAITRAISRSTLKIGISGAVLDKDDLELTADDLTDDSIGEVIKVFLNVQHSKEVEQCIWACCKRAVYDKDKVDKAFFEDVEHRELYFPIIIEVIKVNLRPFMKGLLSQFGELLGQIKTFLGSK